MAVNTARTEKLATNALESALMVCHFLDPDISKNDRTPVWDGRVFVYADASGKKGKLLGQVPIQVKGSYQPDLSKDSISFQADMADLKAYYRDGGAIFFVIYLNDTDIGHKIYYKVLLPFDLHGIVSSDKASHAIHLNRFPENEPNKIMNIFAGFIQERPKQMPIIENGIQSLEDLCKNGIKIEDLTFSVPSFAYDGKDLAEYVSKQDFYLYAKPQGLNIFIPVEKVTDAYFARTINAPISINGHEFYHEFNTIYHRGVPTIQFGKAFTIPHVPEGTPMRINCKFRGTIKERLLDAEFFLALQEHKTVTINGVTASFSTSKNDISETRKLINYLHDTKKMLEILGVTEELDCNNATEQDNKNIHKLINAVIHGVHLRLPDVSGQASHGMIQVSNLSILIWAERDTSGNYSIMNFKNGRQLAYAPTGNIDDGYFTTTHYSLLKEEQYKSASNLDYDDVYNAFTSEMISKDYLSYTNLSVLEMLKGYDSQTKKNPELIKLVEKLFDWLYQNEDANGKDIALLNKLQAIKRQRELTFVETGELYRIRNSDDPYMKCGACILMDDIDTANSILSNLPNDDYKAYFQAMPILHFLNGES